MLPWALSPPSYQGQNTSVSALELRMVCGSVTALIQNIALRCSQEWPRTNITLDNSPVVCVARPKQTGTMMITISLSKSDGFAELATFSIMQTNMDHGAPDLASGKRFHYTSKADKADRADSKHPTVKPVDLIRWLVTLACPPGGHVLDCFAGSGTTGEACMLAGFDCTLIEREAQHARDIEHRIKRWSGLDAPLFADAP
jgi:site-specific DNA-methyltransferase (adenine-specific)